MSGSESIRLAFGDVVSSLKGVLRSNDPMNKPLVPKEAFENNDTVSIRSNSETQGLVRKEKSKNRYHASSPFSSKFEKFKAWREAITNKLRGRTPEKEGQYKEIGNLSEKSSPSSSGTVQMDQVHTAAKCTHDDINSSKSQIDALQSIRDHKQIYSSSERREADRLLDNASALKKSDETLAARESKMSPTEFKHFEKDVQYQRNMSQKWNDDLTHLYDKIEKRKKAELKKAKKKLAKQSEQKIAENAQQLERHQILHEASQKQLDRIRAFQESSLKNRANGFNAQEHDQMNLLLARGNALQLDREGIIHHLLSGNTSKAEAAQLKLQNQSRQWEQEVGRFHQNSLNPDKDMLIDPKNPLPTGLDEKIETGLALRSAPPKKVRGKATLTDRLTTLEQSVRSEAEQTGLQAQALERLMKGGRLKSRDYRTASSLLNTTTTFERTRRALNKGISDALKSEDPDPKQVKRLEKVVKQHLSVIKKWDSIFNRINQA